MSDDLTVAYQQGRCDGLLEYRKEIHTLRAQLAASREREGVLREEPCPCCGGSQFELSVNKANGYMAVDGRLQMHDVVVQFVIGCVGCSETVAVLTEDQVDIYPKRARQALAAAPEPEEGNDGK